MSKLVFVLRKKVLYLKRESIIYLRTYDFDYLQAFCYIGFGRYFISHCAITWFVPAFAADWFALFFALLWLAAGFGILKADWLISLQALLSKLSRLFSSVSDFSFFLQFFRVKFWTEPTMVLLTEDNFPITFSFLRKIGLELWDDQQRRVLPGFCWPFRGSFRKIRRNARLCRKFFVLLQSSFHQFLQIVPIFLELISGHFSSSVLVSINEYVYHVRRVKWTYDWKSSQGNILLGFSSSSWSSDSLLTINSFYRKWENIKWLENAPKFEFHAYAITWQISCEDF